MKTYDLTLPAVLLAYLDTLPSELTDTDDDEDNARVAPCPRDTPVLDFRNVNLETLEREDTGRNTTADALLDGILAQVRQELQNAPRKSPPTP